MRKFLTGAALFVAAASIPFMLGAPRVARSAIRAVAFAGVTRIAIPIGSDFPIETLDGAFFDFSADNSDPITLKLVKQSFTGSKYVDSATSTQVGAVDLYIPAVNVKDNASIYDYLYGQWGEYYSLGSNHPIYGVTAVSNPDEFE